MSAPVRRSPLSRAHAELGAAFVREAGWEVPADYGQEAAERSLLTDVVAIADVTPRGKIDARGDVEGAIGAAGDAIVARITEDWAIVLTEPGGEEVLLPKLESAAGVGAMVTDATHLFAGFALGGPKLPDVLARSTGWDPATLAPGRATGAPIVDVRAVMLRLDLRLPVIEVYVGSELARYAWRTLLEVVRSLGGGPAGWSALRAEGWR